MVSVFDFFFEVSHKTLTLKANLSSRKDPRNLIFQR